MAALAVMMRPTEDGWAIYLTNGQELTRYRGWCSKRLALHHLERYIRSGPPPRWPAWLGRSR